MDSMNYEDAAETSGGLQMLRVTEMILNLMFTVVGENWM